MRLPKDGKEKKGVGCRKGMEKEKRVVYTTWRHETSP